MKNEKETIPPIRDYVIVTLKITLNRIAGVLLRLSLVLVGVVVLAIYVKPEALHDPTIFIAIWLSTGLAVAIVVALLAWDSVPLFRLLGWRTFLQYKVLQASIAWFELRLRVIDFVGNVLWFRASAETRSVLLYWRAEWTTRLHLAWAKVFKAKLILEERLMMLVPMNEEQLHKFQSDFIELHKKVDRTIGNIIQLLSDLHEGKKKWREMEPDEITRTIGRIRDVLRAFRAQPFPH